MTPAALAEARRLAEEAIAHAVDWGAGGPPEPHHKAEFYAHPSRAAFIAHCNPAFVLELVREVERLTAKLRSAYAYRESQEGLPPGTLTSSKVAALANPAAEAEA